MTAEQFKERFLCLYPKLFAIAMANTGYSDEAKDVMQSLYLKLWEKRNELNDVGNEMGYCRTVLMNLCHDRWRSKAIEPEWTVVEEDLQCEAHAGFESDDIKEKVERFISKLPERQRCIMMMRMQGATTDEIIAATGLTVENVRTILSRTRLQVKEFYDKINR
ncbi:MAG: sigma-70 family RNA polymerase sigma factor [Bacteroidaceae bacterium]|nr:sigma-70 family RNA polymerase sigma factor [Bacteroidaceae bacterium]